MQTLSQFQVRDVCRLGDGALMVITPETEVADVVRQFSASSELRGIFVADPDGKLMGVITRTDLLDWARVRLGASLFPPYRDLQKTFRLVSLIRASTAGELMHPGSAAAAISLEAPLTDALRRMVELDLIVLPVVDEQDRLVGEITLASILAVGLKDEQRPD